MPRRNELRADEPWTCEMCFPLVKGIGAQSRKAHIAEKHPNLKLGYRNVGITGHQKAENFRRYGHPYEEGD
jgi:hypothetical protein